MEETKVEVKAVEEKPAKRPYNRQKKTETEVKPETAEVTKDTEAIEVDVAEEKAKTEVKVANEAKPKEAEAEEKKEEVKAEVEKEEDAEKPETKKAEAVEVKAEEPERSAEKPEEAAEEPAKQEEKVIDVKPEEPAKPAEQPEEATAVLSIEKPEIEPDTPELKPSYLIKRPIPIYYMPKVTVGSKWFVGVVRVLDKVNDKFVKVAYKDSGSGANVTAYILASSLPQ